MGERYRAAGGRPPCRSRPTRSSCSPTPRRARSRSRLSPGRAGRAGVLRPELPAGFAAEPATAPFTLSRRRRDDAHASTSARGGHPSARLPGTLRVGRRRSSGDALARGFVRIEHAHIPIQTWLADADVRLAPLDAGAWAADASATSPARATRCRQPAPGRLRGDAARRRGAAPAQRAARASTPSCSGVRAFNTSERLRAAHGKLMDYVRPGGTLVVQYNTNNRLAPLPQTLGPWPFNIGQDASPTRPRRSTFAVADHRRSPRPNRIGPHDFEGWVQERGLYFAEKWDPRYATPLSMHDPGEPPQAGSCCGRARARGPSSTPGSRSSGSSPPACPARSGCSPTCSLAAARGPVSGQRMTAGDEHDGAARRARRRAALL